MKRIIIHNPKVVCLNGVQICNDLLLDQVQRTIEKELLKRSILVDIIVKEDYR